MYKILVGDVLLCEVIAEREAQLAALPAHDSRRLVLRAELIHLYDLQAHLARMNRRETERRTDGGPLRQE
jgi:hypothetical protein